MAPGMDLGLLEPLTGSLSVAEVVSTEKSGTPSPTVATVSSGPTSKG